MKTPKMQFCLKAATSLSENDLDDLTDAITKYLEAGVSQAQAETMAVDDLTRQVMAEREALLAAGREQFPDAFPSEVDMAAAAAATSPENDLPAPTAAQKEAGNYKMGHLSLHGLDITVENPKGSERRAIDDSWVVRSMPAHYGYFKRTEGADGDHVDVFIGPNAESTKVWVINQKHQDGAFDEHKVMLGFDSAAEAKKAYLGSFSGKFGSKVFESISAEMDIDGLKATMPTLKKAKPVEVAVDELEALNREVMAAKRAEFAAPADGRAELTAARQALEARRDAVRRGNVLPSIDEPNAEDAFRQRLIDQELFRENPARYFTAKLNGISDQLEAAGYEVIPSRNGNPPRFFKDDELDIEEMPAAARALAEEYLRVDQQWSDAEAGYAPDFMDTGLSEDDAEDPTSNPAFMRWFKKSKVVRENGEPRVVYRGRVPGSGDSTRSTVPYFAVERDAAVEYAMQYDDGTVFDRDGNETSFNADVLEAYLSIQNPAYEADIERVAKEAGIDLLIDGRPAAYLEESPELVAALKNAGYDGVYGWDDRPDNGGEIRVWAPFSPTQIKSVNNDGTFGEDDPNFLRSIDAGVMREATEQEDEALEEFGYMPSSSVEAARAFNDGDAVFVMHDQADVPSLILSPTVLKKYQLDQMMILPAEHIPAAEGTEVQASEIEVDGVMRPTLNSEGRPIHSTADGIRNFWRAFGGSKMVDDQGRPLVSTHYTGAEFDVFDHDEQRKAQYDGKGYTTSFGYGYVFPRKGFFFFAGDRPAPVGDRRAVEVYLAIKNPLDLTQRISPEDTSKIIDFVQAKQNREASPGHWGYRVKGAALGGFREARKNGITPAQLFAFVNTENTGPRGERWNDILTALGKDGLIFDGNSSGTANLEPMRGTGDGKTYRIAVALNSTQIKSATGNLGTYDPTDPNIRRSVSEDPAARDQSDLVDRNKYLAELERLIAERPISPVQVVPRLRKLLRDAEAGRPINATEVERLLDQLEARNERQADARVRPLTRGPLWIRERLTREMRTGSNPEAAQLALWFLEQNPSMAEGLAISFKAKGEAAGTYDEMRRLATIIEGASAGTGIHEILHHTERMMPDAVQAGIRAEWARQLKKQLDFAIANNLEPLIRAVTLAMAGRNEDVGTLIEAIREGEIPFSFYQYVNPSEFWAVNGTRIMKEREAAPGWLAQMDRWIEGLIEKLKEIFGLSSDAPVLRALDAVLKSDGEYLQRFGLAGGLNLSPRDDQIVSTRVPTAKPRGKNPPPVENPISDRLQVGLAPFRAVPDALANALRLLTSYVNWQPNPRLRGDARLEKFIGDAVDNLIWLYDQVPASIRQRSKLWYDGANVIANNLAKKYGVTVSQASAVLAVNSPQTEWFTNVTRGERILDIWFKKQNFRWSPEMQATARAILGKPKYASSLRAIRGKTLGEISADNLLSAMWLRVYDEAHNDRRHRIVTPEGAFGDFVMTDQNDHGTAAWASFSHIVKSISIIKDGSIDNVSVQLGGAHKVRSFYNNIFSPNDPVGDVTIDTHAVAAGLLRPLSGSSIEVVHNLGGGVSNALTGLSGTYGIYAEAYRRAAQRVGLLPREMQSITWEAIRGMYTAGFKNSAGKGRVEQAWQEYRAGRLDEAGIRARVLEISGGVNEPNWWRSDSRAPTQGWTSSYGGELVEFQPSRPAAEAGADGVPPRGAGRSRARQGGAPRRVGRSGTLPSIDPAANDAGAAAINPAEARVRKAVDRLVDTAAALGVEVPRFKKTTPVQTMVADLSYMLGMNEQVRALPEAQKANLRRFWDEVESAAGALRRAQSVPVKIGSAQGFRTGRPVKVEVYHGSDRPVTGFDPLKLGDNTGARSASMGFFFAGRQSTSQAYLRPNKESVTITPEKALAMPRARLGELIDGWQTQSMSGDFVYDWINEILVEELGARPIKNNPTEGGDGMPDRGSLTKWVKTAPKEAIRSLVTAINAYDQQYPLTEDPWSEDGGAEGMGSVSRYVVDLVNPYVHDYKGEGYRDVPYAEVIAKAKADGHDGVILMNTRDPGPEVDNIFVVFDPGQAQFDGVAFGDTLPSIDELPPENLKNLETWSGSKGIGPADEQVRVYRAVPKGSKQTAIQPGDWVSANRDYLTEYAGRDATVIEATIPANELVDAQTGAVARDTLIWTPSNASGAFEAATRDWPAALRDRTLEEGVAYQQTQVEGLFPDGERLLDEAADRLMDELNNPADLDGASDAFIARAEEAEFRDEIIAALRAAPYRPTGNPETLNAAAFVRRGTGAPVESLARQIERAGGARGFLSGNVLPSIDDPLAGEHGRKDGTPAERAAALKQATDAMNAPPLPPPTWAGPLFKDMGTFSKYAVHPRTIAAFDKAFTPIYRVAEAQIEARDRIASELATKAQAYFDLPKVGKARVHAVLELGRLKGEVLSGKKMSMTNEGEPAQLSSDGEMITLSDAEKTAYWGVRNMLNDALDRFRDQALTDFGIDPAEFQGKGVSKRLIEMADAIPTGFAGNARAQALRTAATIVDEIEQARRTGYVPFSRFGDIVVTVKDADNATIWASKVDSTGMLNTVRKKFGAAVVADIPAVRAEMDRLRDKFRGQDVTVGAFQAQSLAEGQSDVRMADIDMLAEVANVNNQQWDAIREQLERAVKAKGFRKHFFGASNTPGYSTDFERSLSDYMLGMAGYLARRQALPKWEAAIGAMPTQKANLIAYAKTYRDYVQNPTEEWQRLRQFGFLWYLAGVPATALVNLTQVDLLTAPYLMQFAGAARVQVELQKARLEAAGMVSLNAGMDVFSPEKAPADVRDDLQEAWDEGFFVPLNTYELMGTAYTGSRGQRTFDRAFRTVIDAVALTFTAAERHNRVATFIAAHRIARMPGIQEKVQAQLAANALARDTLGDWTPKGFAQWVIDETHFRMGKVNRPTITRGIGAPLLQFKGFTMQSLERWITMALLQGPQGKKAMLISLGVMWLMSGFWGLPGADDLRDLFEKMYKALAGKDFDTETKLREAVVELTGSPRIAQAFSKGSTFPMGLDLSGRMGMGNIAPDTPLAMLGIPGDLFIGRPTKFIERASQDNWSGAFAELAPNFIKNPMQAATWADRGVSTIRGRRVITPDQLDAVDIGMRAIGFQPSKVTNERERQFAERRAATSIDEMRRDYYTRVSQALADEDRAIRKGDAAAAKAAREKVQDAYSDIAKHNDSAEDSERIELNENTLRRRVAQDLNGPSAVRKQARGRAEEIREVYGRTR